MTFFNEFGSQLQKERTHLMILILMLRAGSMYMGLVTKISYRVIFSWKFHNDYKYMN